jgi:hypothetical protein
VTIRGTFDRASAAPRLGEYRCEACGYGAVRPSAPGRCPMCSGNIWTIADETAPPLLIAEDTDIPLARESRGGADLGSVFLGVPLS